MGGHGGPRIQKWIRKSGDEHNITVPKVPKGRFIMIIHWNWGCLIFRPKWLCLHRNLTTLGFEWIEDLASLEATKNGMKLTNFFFQRIYAILK